MARTGRAAGSVLLGAEEFPSDAQYVPVCYSLFARLTYCCSISFAQLNFTNYPRARRVRCSGSLPSPPMRPLQMIRLAEAWLGLRSLQMGSLAAGSSPPYSSVACASRRDASCYIIGGQGEYLSKADLSTSHTYDGMKGR